MGRLHEVRKEIEQLCDEIERDALRSCHRSETSDEVTPAPPVHIHVVVPSNISRMRIRISLQQGNLKKRR
ncbi:hypothetical protein ACFPTO_04510 [Paraburkholderia denitrificans]|uniref:Uncharacterized protein n=1 Tax=Paraburkholderia denitrificans TaxID=694025 RepID=A0ABW0J4Z0_9BURK